ncbi:hypothetical protein [Goodfellowiella coeruleoviolacea]|uniref:Uncharacterized protein n=1 Tax=Goodfellowiella coeruleoviolacea TaxID=334858 RepID=A0AAE3GLR3_9PSEU|nr:hypothetical protein [Goodfellowiella coeruleoviolacea]MCP2168313.1 hypothetical protein [Goodfellowiella coeruleoviolacea]
MTATHNYRWLMSEYDATWHCFPSSQVDDPARRFLEASCNHSVPVSKVLDAEPRKLCPDCLLSFGKLLLNDWPRGSSH